MFREVTSIYFGGFCFLVPAVNQMVLGPVICPANVHFTPVFALRNSNFSKWGNDSPLPSLKFCPCLYFCNSEEIDGIPELFTLSIISYARA